MKRKSMLTMLVLSTLTISGCNNTESSFESESSFIESESLIPSFVESFESIEDSSTSIIESSNQESSDISSSNDTPILIGDGWDKDRLNYINPNPTLKPVANEAEWIDYSTSSNEEKTKIVGELEKYLINNNLSGLPLFGDGGYIKYSDRVIFPTQTKKDSQGNDVIIDGTTRYEYIYNYGFGIIQEGNLQGELPTEVNFANYYHTYQTNDPLTLNVASSNNPIINSVYGYTSGVFFTTRLADDKLSYEWYPSLASEENKLSNGSTYPLPLNVAEDGSKTVVYDASKNDAFINYRVYVKTGEDAVYNTLSTKEEIKEFKGRSVQLEDYITPYKEIHNQSNKISKGKQNLTGINSIKGMKEYYEATSEGYNQEAWDNVGIKPGVDSKGAYIDFELNNKCVPYSAMLLLSSFIYSPIPKSFVDLLGGFNNLNSFVDDIYTPVDTTLSIGPYCVEEWNKNESIVFKKNELISDEINGGAHRYQMPGIHVSIYEEANSDQNYIYNQYNKGLIDEVGVPMDKIKEEAYAKGTQVTNNGSTSRLNYNLCDQQMWEYLFGENGTITQTKKEDYWDVKPAMSNNNFLKGIHLSINREKLALSVNCTPSIDLLGDYYSIDKEAFNSYNKSQTHKDNLLSYYGDGKLIDSYGYDFDLAIEYFNKAAKELLSTGAYKEGDVIQIEICWQVESQVNGIGKEIEQYIEKAFNDEKVCENKLRLDINTTYTPVWSDIYYKKMMCGKYDIAYGIISGSSYFNIWNYFELHRSDNSSGFTLNWGVDTNSTNKLIEYNDKKFTFDALLEAVNTGAVVKPNGQSATLYDATIISNTLNEDNSRTIVIDYVFSSVEDVIEIEIENLELWWYDAENSNGYEYKEIEYEDNGNGTITITIDNETASSWLGEISIDINIKIKCNQEKTCWDNYISLESEFNL